MCRPLSILVIYYYCCYYYGNLTPELNHCLFFVFFVIKFVNIYFYLGLHDDTLTGKSDELVVLSETPIYRQEESTADIVYTTGILDHEEVAQVDFDVSRQVNYSEDMHSRTYSQSEQLNADVNFSQSSGVNFSQQDVVSVTHHSNDYDDHTDYIDGENLQEVSAFVEAKDLSNAFLSPADKDDVITADDFIGAEEVTVSHYHHQDISSSEDNLSTSGQFSDVKGEVGVNEIGPLMEWDEHLHKP